MNYAKVISNAAHSDEVYLKGVTVRVRRSKVGHTHAIYHILETPLTQSESCIMMTVSAAVRLIPSPPARVLVRNTKQSGSR